MATSTITLSKTNTIVDYFMLAKPKTIFPHLITAAAAMFVATGGIPPMSTLLLTLLGGGLVAGAANSFNSYKDRDIDALMIRTRHRPLPSRRMKPGYALIFGIGTGLIGALILDVFVNWIAGTLAVIALLYYVLAYTILLKRRTYWATIVGSGIGAFPPLIGWAAVSQVIQMTPFLLCAVVIFWTIPHFWTLAVFRRDDYARAGLDVAPASGISMWILICSILLLVTGIVLKMVANLGAIYLSMAVFLNTGLLILIWRTGRQVSQQSMLYLYRYSIYYIAALFCAIILDRLVF